MAKALDVVAVLRREIENAGRLGPRASDARAKRLRQVEGAVAELIAAAERGQALVESGAIRARQSEQDDVSEWADMLDAALAACKPTGAEK